MADRYAVLLDGGFVRKRIQRRDNLPHRVGLPEVLAECQRIRDHDLLRDRELLRIYWYDAKPATGQIFNPLDRSNTNLAKTPVYRESIAFLEKLELEPDVALRLGELDLAPAWKITKERLKEIAKNGGVIEAGDVHPAINQKGVDLRIGLDMARLALRGLVSTIVVVTSDSDMIPAFKFVRREGVRLYLDTLGWSVKRDLRAHADAVIG